MPRGLPASSMVSNGGYVRSMPTTSSFALFFGEQPAAKTASASPRKKRRFIMDQAPIVSFSASAMRSASAEMISSSRPSMSRRIFGSVPE